MFCCTKLPDSLEMFCHTKLPDSLKIFCHTKLPDSGIAELLFQYPLIGIASFWPDANGYFGINQILMAASVKSLAIYGKRKEICNSFLQNIEQYLKSVLDKRSPLIS